ncbi:helix-turn-helix domain-containing protein [Anoxynatronum sibiricum]|uniref:Helix-turn-helix domain-containing protein n=1 Tax=Anoxynatronum sibiricum TaxID=210623 RepID=A0ABU9VXC6_9CLOT
MFEEYGEILTVEEVMEILMIGKNGVYELLKKGELNGFRIGRVHKIPKVSLEEYILSKATHNSLGNRRAPKKK